ncbi:UDP-N-acetylglucosamine--N-acetylmuramyl-(pentapeptide) pyrophosphoryl-undecaprenol N-acetylglucosamine transferase [uncultured spirochete]|uniref:UDP-N-acetylglucosamine--N-acetylmuramyl-(pentapeptide) pyrophosphoryl-undecaprenol N-acetylglucosamine transferase n=1 Tax=uncultured spirochete TaxID=156406 RepID=A0A3P3XT59_9SPIR|nr:UDP-N-acetylglucosamine--N-acetylmuramyl-(pentapeptide) pyrophosphoryl-undecaprenol N-acetylglucosamine transferase [uncultured spirochete]
MSESKTTAEKNVLDNTSKDMSVARPCIAFTGGGTGGHIYPGLAVIEELRHLGFEGRIAWIGSEKDLDRSIVAEQGVEYFAIPSGKFRRELSLRNLTDLWRIVAGYVKAKSILKNLRPSLLFSKGGYVSVPPCRASTSLGIPVITHESDTSPGLATRLNSKRASLILTSWEATADYFPEPMRAKIVRTGNPVRPALFLGDRTRGLDMLGFSAEKPVLFVLGGSQGAKEVNDLVLASLPFLCTFVQIVHQTGKANFDEVVSKIPDDPVVRASYRPLSYIGPEIADIYAASSIIAGRAGAGTVWEAASLGKPMILIPLSGPGTRGDQVENAALAARAGAAAVLEGAQLSPATFADAVKKYLHRETYDSAVRACYSIAGIPAQTVRALLGDRDLSSEKQMPSAEFIARLLLARFEQQAKEGT